MGMHGVGGHEPCYVREQGAFGDFGGKVSHQSVHPGHLGEGELGVEEKGSRGCMEKYHKGFRVCKTKEGFGMAFNTITDLAEVFPNSSVRIVKNIIKLLEFGKVEDLLEMKHYKFWLELQDLETHKKGMMELVKHSLTQYPTSVELWIEQLVLRMKVAGP